MNKCIKCKKEVKKDEWQVFISTRNRPNKKPDDNAYFHFQCFHEFWHEGVEKQVRAKVDNMREMAFSLLNNPMIRGFVDKMGAGEQLNTVLEKPLTTKDPVIHVVTKKEIEKKIKDGRKRETKRETKSKMQ